MHLDLGFSEPLVPDDEDAEPGELPAVQPRRRPRSRAPRPGIVEPGPRTVVVAGDGADTGLGPQAREVALAAGWPLLAEPSSGAAGPDAVAAYRLLLEMPELGGAVERAVVYGRPTLSRPVTRLLERPDVDLALVAADGDWPNPGRPAARLAPLGLATLPPASARPRVAAPVGDGVVRRPRRSGRRPRRSRSPRIRICCGVRRWRARSR